MTRRNSLYVAELAPQQRFIASVEMQPAKPSWLTSWIWPVAALIAAAAWVAELLT